MLMPSIKHPPRRYPVSACVDAFTPFTPVGGIVTLTVLTALAPLNPLKPLAPLAPLAVALKMDDPVVKLSLVASEEAVSPQNLPCSDMYIGCLEVC